MKTLFSLVLGLALVVSAPAQSVAILTTTLNGGTNNVAATAANTMSSVSPAYVVKSDYAAFQISGKLTGAGTSAVTVMIDTSVDGVVWKPNVHALAFTANGTNVAGNNTNILFGAVHYWRFSYATNANANAVTNLTWKYSDNRGL